MECINGRMEIDMKEAGSTASNMEKLLTCLLMVTSTPETTLTVNLMELVFTNGKMVVFIPVSSKKD